MADLQIRPYVDPDEDTVLEILGGTLGKVVDDRYRGFFRWKHLENPFGRSFMWVGEIDGRLAGFRAFLRWRFRSPRGEPVEAVRAVDTATHPDFQGRGIFRALTLHALEEVRAAGIEFVFNTPNDTSRPGYLKMGWSVEGRTPVKVRPRSLPAIARMVRARTSADIWSLPADVGDPVEDLGDLLAAERHRAEDALVTDRDAEVVRWRYAGYPAVASRALRAGPGAVLVRFRRRGASVECTVGDVLGAVPRRQAAAAVQRAMRVGGADYALATRGTPIGGMVPIRGLGPVQTRRPVSDAPNRLPLALTLGELELF